jgi:hypothetical protein
MIRKLSLITAIFLLAGLAGCVTGEVSPLPPDSSPAEYLPSPDSANINGNTLYVDGSAGDDNNSGRAPGDAFRSINKAAQEAMPGYTVIVAAGLYREHVKPLRGGSGEDGRITYIADGDVTIKGSERITDWSRLEGGVWQITLPDSFFEEFGSGGATHGARGAVINRTVYNPYKQVHWHGGGGHFEGYNAGDVYLDGEAFRQMPDLDYVYSLIGTWFSEYSDRDGDVTIYANFGADDPNERLAEINVRRQVFAPDVWGLQYITVDGFTIKHAANWYSDFPDQPERAQRGAISVYGGRRWIIQNNRVINARTIGVDIGLGCDMWAGNRDANDLKIDGRLKTHFTDTDKYGEHIVQNNYFARNGQSAIAGVFSWSSVIRYNHMEDNNYRDEFSGAETAPIKVHYMNYGLIEGNYIINSRGGNSAGIWVDWGCQGVRVTRNIVLYCPWGFYSESMHGPVLVDNNIFLRNRNLRTLDASGVVFANNMIVGNGSFYIDGQGRNNFWFMPGTMEVGGEVRQPGQEFWWYNNLSAMTRMPETRTEDGYTWTHNKYNESSAILFFDYDVEDGIVEITFNFDNEGVNLVPVTRDEIGAITFPMDYIIGEDIPGDVPTDFFGNPYIAGSAVAGPFADIQNGDNVIRLWPIEGQKTPAPFLP